jgi:hypothetical protein
MIAVRDTLEGAQFTVRVTPRASKTAVVGVIGEGAEAAVKIALHAPPVEGKANAALVEFLAEVLGVRRSAIEIAAGEHARNKVILVRGMKAAAVAAILERIVSAAK